MQARSDKFVIDSTCDVTAHGRIDCTLKLGERFVIHLLFHQAVADTVEAPRKAIKINSAARIAILSFRCREREPI
ncbi:MAG: hypothetical protein RL701_6007 [Pseudomonadota bacterium]|jgi:hypothetical protein